MVQEACWREGESVRPFDIDNTDVRRLDRIRRLSVGFVLCFAIGVAVLAGACFTRGNYRDFYHFYHGARAVVDDTDLYASGMHGYIYPPLFALLLAPLSGLGIQESAIVWTVFSGALMVAALLLIAFELQDRFELRCGWTSVWAITAVGLLFNFEKCRLVILSGQSDNLTLFLLACAFRTERRWPMLCGTVLGLAANIKYQSLIFLPYLILRGRLRETGGLLLGLAAGLLSGVPVFGWERNGAYVVRALSGLFEMTGAVEHKATSAQVSGLTWLPSTAFPSTLARMIDQVANPRLFLTALALVTAATFAIGWHIVARHGFAMFRNRGGERERQQPLAVLVAFEWGGLITACMVFSPQSTGRHMALMTFVSCLAAMLLFFPVNGLTRRPVVIALLVFIAGLTLPPGAKPFYPMVNAWRFVGGPAWCALAFYLVVLDRGLAWLQVRAMEGRKANAGTIPSHGGILAPFPNEHL